MNYFPLLSLPIFLCAVASEVKAQFVEISSELELIALRTSETNTLATAKPRIISSVCVTGHNCWRIEDDGVQGGINKVFFDGTNVFQSIQVTQMPSEELQQTLKQTKGPALVPFDTAKSNLTINIWPSTDGHPLSHETFNITWLAFCSGSYLRRDGRLIPLPCEWLRHTPDRYAYTDRTEVFSDAAGLPRSIDLFMSRAHYLASVEDFYHGWGTRYLPWMRTKMTNIVEGALTFHYTVTATTNFEGSTYPLRFEFFQKGRDFLQNEGWFKQGVGRLKSIRRAEAPKGLFNAQLQQTIVDWRSYDAGSGANAKTYTWANEFTP